ncbi:MAG: penicillin acylase family protein, partial [Deltaproteobacteria bacterium]
MNLQAFRAALFRCFLPLVATPSLLLLLSPACPTRREAVRTDVSERVEVIYDEFGIPHIYAANEADLYFAQGYVEARDRLFQMDTFRRAVRGELAAMLGPDFVEDDRDMRRIGLGRLAEALAADIRARAEVDQDPEFIEIRMVLERFAAGINAYLEGVFSGRNPLPVEYLGIYGREVTPEDIRPWEMEDILAMSRFGGFSLSYAAGDDVGLLARRRSYVGAFGRPGEPGQLPGRFGFFDDLYCFEPPVKVPIVAPGETKVPSPAKRTSMGKYGVEVSDALLEGALAFFDRIERNSWIPMRRGGRGSNNWAVSGAHTASGYPLLANDPHLDLVMPTLIYLSHLNTKRAGGEINAVGINFAGIPGVGLGHNETMGWGTTVLDADVTDVYVEIVTRGTGGAPDTVRFDDPFDDPDQGPLEVPIEEITETIEIRDPESGQIHTEDDVVRIVPHHGPIIAETEDAAMSVRWAGYTEMHESGAIISLMKARNLGDFIEATKKLVVGTANYAYADVEGNIYYSGQSLIPERAPAALTPETPPYLPLPGQGQHEWIGYRASEDIPHILNPSKGYFATANHSPDGGNFDNDPLNDAHYLGTYFAVGYRGKRISDRIAAKIAAGEKITFEEMQSIQADHHSNTAEQLLPHLLAAAEENPGGLADDPFVQAAIARLSRWDLWTPSGFDRNGNVETNPQVLESAVAATIYNLWQNHFLWNAISDEIETVNALFPDNRVGFISSNGSTPGFRGIVRNLIEPEVTFTGALLFDDYRTP